MRFCLEDSRDGFGLLGWKLAMSEEKRTPFGKKFHMLGAVVDLTPAAQGLVQISNKPTRVEELLLTAQKLELGDEITESQLQSLRGRLLYAAGNTLEGAHRVAVQALGELHDVVLKLSWMKKW